MARDWVKISTSMLFHADTQELPADTFRAWVNLLLVAGTVDDDGRVGPLANVAYALHMKPDELSEHVTRLNGRIALDDDGSLRIRDWYEWQTRSDRDRKRTQRSRAVTNGHAASRAVTDGHVCPSREEMRREETRSTDTPLRGGAAVAAPLESEDPEGGDAAESASQPEPPAAKPTKRAERAAEHSALFEAVCSAAGWSTTHLAETDRDNAGKLARELGRADPPWDPHDVYLAGKEWLSVKFKSRRPSEVRPPTIAQLRTWLGECRTRWNQNAWLEEAVQR